MQILTQIHWASVLVASVAAFAVGGLWYSPLMFSKRWVKEVKITDDQIQGANMPLIFGSVFILNVVSAVVLDFIIGPCSCLMHGLLTGFGISVAFIATSIGVQYLFARRSMALYLIDIGYFITFYSIMGAILGVW